MNCTAFTYYIRHANGQMHMWLIASSVKIIAIKCIAVVYGFKHRYYDSRVRIQA